MFAAIINLTHLFAQVHTQTTGAVGIEQIVWFVFTAIIVIAILAICWWAIGYGESKMPMPMAWNVVRVVFVLLVAFLLIAVLLSLIGHPIVRF